MGTMQAPDGGSNIIHVTAILPGMGAELGMLVAEEPTRFTEFLREAAWLDQGYKRWEYVRGVNGAPGAGAQIVGLLPPDLRYTGFEGYWAGSGKSPEAILAEEAALGVGVMVALARLSGTERAWDAGLDIFQHPYARALRRAILGESYALSHLRELEPVFGETLAWLRAAAERREHAEDYAAFQVAVEAAVHTVGAAVYVDPGSHELLHDLAQAGRNVEGRDLEERYDLPRAPRTNHRLNATVLTGRERAGYEIICEIGRLGHPIVRALLHIANWPAASRAPRR